MEKRSHKPVILVVDDDAAVLKFSTRTLERAGYQVDAVSTLAAAEAMVSKVDYDVVVSDIFLDDGPMEGGIRLLEHCLKQQPDTPVILVTGMPSVDTASGAVRLGAYDYLPKPLDLGKLENITRRAIELKYTRVEKARVEAENQRLLKHLEEVVEEQFEQIIEKEKRYRTLFQSSLDAVFITDENRVITEVNPAACTLFGLEKERLLGLTVKDLCADPRSCDHSFAAIQKDGFIQNFEFRGQRPDGTMVDCLLTANLRRSSEKKMIGVQGIIRDITVRKRAQEQIQQQNAFLNSVIESLTHPFVVIDAETCGVEMANSAARDRRPGGLSTCHELLHGSPAPCNAAECICPVDRVRSTRGAVQMQHDITDDDGRQRTYEIHGYPVMGENSAVSRIILYIIDITERIRDRQKMLRLSTAVQQTADAVVVMDDDGRIVYVNPAFETITGYAAAEVMDAPFSLFHGHTESGQPIAEVLRSGQVWQHHVNSTKKDGTAYSEEVVISPVRDADGRVCNFVAISRDLTQRRRLESIAEAANLMENIGYIFSGIRHEIGNPVNSIKMALTVLSKNLLDYSTDKTQEFIDRALTETKRVEYLLGALKNYSLFEHPEIESIDLDGFMSRFLSLVRDDFERKHIDVSYTGGPGGLLVAADPRALHHILLNVMTNAADAMVDSKETAIHMSAEPEGRFVALRFADTGKGMSADEVRQLFTPFFTTKRSGTGLGMVIVRKMLSQMAGHIAVDSQPGVGTTVTIRLKSGEKDAR